MHFLPGVALANGERWRQLRRFSLTTLRNFGMGKRSIEERIQEEAQYLLQEFRKTQGWSQPASRLTAGLPRVLGVVPPLTTLVFCLPGLPFDPTFYLSRTVSNVISSVVFGSRFDYEDQTFLSLLRMFNEAFIEMSTPWAQVASTVGGGGCCEGPRPASAGTTREGAARCSPGSPWKHLSFTVLKVGSRNPSHLVRWALTKAIPFVQICMGVNQSFRSQKHMAGVRWGGGYPKRCKLHLESLLT